MNIHDLFFKKTGRDTSIQQAQEELARLEKLVAEQQDQLAYKDQLLEQAARDLAEKDRIIAQLNSELKDKENAIELKDTELDTKNQEIQLLKEREEQTQAQLDWLKRQVFGNKSARTSTLDTDTINGQMAMLFPGQTTGEKPAGEPGSEGAAVEEKEAEGSCNPQEKSTPEDGETSAKSGNPTQESPLFDGVLLVEEEVREGQEIKVDSYTRKTGKTVTRKTTFKEITASLKQNAIRIPATDEQRVCGKCGEEMEHLGWEEIRTEIIVRPAAYEANVYYAETLKCTNCSSDEKSIIVKTNNVPPAVIPRSLASCSLIADNAIMKYELFVPGYRLEQYVLAHGLFLTRSSMANQMIYVSKNYLVVMYEWLHRELKTRPIINADETPGKVNLFKELVPWADAAGRVVDPEERDAGQAALTEKAKSESEDGKLHQKKIYMWLYASRYGTDHPIDIYDYQPSKAGACCAAFLGKDYSGYLITDGYSGYNIFEMATRCSCIAHFRDYWYEAIKTKQGKLDKSDPAVVGFLFSNRLFQIEREVADKDPEEKVQERAAAEKPLWEWFWTWQQNIEASGGSPLYKALVYARNQRDTLENYTLDGNLPLTNVRAELLARAYATGRKNFLFHESAEGARSAAILMTLIRTAKANGLNPELYLNELLECRQEYLDDPEKCAEFAPWSERMQKNCVK